MLSTNSLRLGLGLGLGLRLSFVSAKIYSGSLSLPQPLSFLSLRRATSMEASDSSHCTLVLCGKSAAENEVAKSLRDTDALKLSENDGVSMLLRSELESDSDERFEKDAFRIDGFMNSLSTKRFGRFLIWSPRLPSTHDVVSLNFGELPVGAACVADIQYKGRGRSKNIWESPKGALMFSFTLQMEDGRVVPLVQYVVSLAVTEAIKEICDKNGLPYVDVRIKWPNDLYLNNLKVGGVLCTSTYNSKKFNVSVGIGLNVDNEKPTTCLNAFLKELSDVDYKFMREDILAFFFSKFEHFYHVFMDKGSGSQIGYENLLTALKLQKLPLDLLGQRVIVQEKNEDQVVENVVTIQGLTASGYLLAVGDDYRMCELHPDGNSFDFFKGLVRRKL